MDSKGPTYVIPASAKILDREQVRTRDRVLTVEKTIRTIEDLVTFTRQARQLDSAGLKFVGLTVNHNILKLSFFDNSVNSATDNTDEHR